MSKINPFQTKSEFLRIAWINKKLTGEAFWLKIRNKQGQVVELWNLRPDLMTVVQDDTAYIKHYEFAKYDGGKVIFQREDVIFFKDPDPLNPLRGQSPIGAAKHRVETETQATRFQKEFFKNNARPDALLISTESMGEDQRNQMISDWEEEHGGPEKAGRIGILEGGMKYQQVSISQKEMDFIESLKFTRGDILVALGVPESVIFSNASNFATADSDFRSFLSETIVPELNQLCEVLNEMLVIPDFGEQWYLDFVDPTVEDRASVRADNTAGFGKWLTVNEIRAGLNLPPIDGGDVIQSQDGGQPTVSPTDLAKAQKAAERKKKTLDILKGRRSLKLSFDVGIIMKNELGSIAEMRKKLLKNKTKTKVTAKKKSVQKDEVPSNISIFSSEESRNSYYNLVNKRIDTRSKKFKGKLGELFIKQRNEVLSKLQKFDNKKDINAKIGVGDVAKLLNKNAQIGIFSTVALPFLLDYATQGGKDAARLLGEEFDMSGALRDAIESRSDFFADSVVNTQFQKLVNTLTEGIENEESYTDLTQRVHDIYDDLPDWKAEQVARTETTYATNSGMEAQFNDSQVADGKEWVAVMDVRTRDSHASQNGQIVKLDGVFKNGMRFPGDSSDASEVINCRCVIAPTVGLQKALKGGPGSGGAREGAGRKPGMKLSGNSRQGAAQVMSIANTYLSTPEFTDLVNKFETNMLESSSSEEIADLLSVRLTNKYDLDYETRTDIIKYMSGKDSISSDDLEHINSIVSLSIESGKSKIQAIQGITPSATEKYVTRITSISDADKIIHAATKPDGKIDRYSAGYLVSSGGTVEVRDHAANILFPDGSKSVESRWGTYENFEKDFIRSWTYSSNDANALEYKVAIQQAFGGNTFNYSPSGSLGNIEPREIVVRRVNEMYAKTQASLSKDNYTLYRGVSKEIVVHSAIESWTSSKAIAKKFDGHGVMQEKISKDAILGTYETITNWPEARVIGKKEYIVLGSKLNSL